MDDDNVNQPTPDEPEAPVVEPEQLNQDLPADYQEKKVEEEELADGSV